jgi:hypothetical protein
MANADQSFGWWSLGDLQGNASTDSEPALYSNPHSFNQTDGVYQQPYDLNPGQRHGEAEGNDIRLPILANPNMQGPAMMPISDGVSGPPGSSFHTAPPHPLPPSQVHGLRGYYTDPQPRDGQRRDTAAVNGMLYDRAGTVGVNHFMVSLHH